MGELKLLYFTINDIEIPKHLLGDKAGLVVRNTLKQVNQKLEQMIKQKTIAIVDQGIDMYCCVDHGWTFEEKCKKMAPKKGKLIITEGDTDESDNRV